VSEQTGEWVSRLEDAAVALGEDLGCPLGGGASAAVVSVVATVGLDVLTFGFRDRWSVLGWRSSSLDLVFLTVTVGLVLYSRSLVEREILR
jgi:hypothetical protein